MTDNASCTIEPYTVEPLRSILLHIDPQIAARNPAPRPEPTSGVMKLAYVQVEKIGYQHGVSSFEAWHATSESAVGAASKGITRTVSEHGMRPVSPLEVIVRARQLAIPDYAIPVRSPGAWPLIQPDGTVLAWIPVEVDE